jgi:g-D-glutamyl-meso-diaminopimelate peptidase
MALATVMMISVLLSGCGEFFALPAWAPAPSKTADAASEEPGGTQQAEQEYTVAAKEFLSLWAEPSTSAEVLRRLPPGAVVLVKYRTGSFAFVEVCDTGETGYVVARYLLAGEGKGPQANPSPSASLAPALPPGEEAAEWLAQCDEFLTLRSAPVITNNSIGRVLKGAKVKVDAFEGLFARITDAEGRRGYVMAGYLTPAKQDKWLAGLDVVKPVEKYSYEQMVKDLKKLASRYPGKLRLESAGTTLEGRDIPVAVLGDPGAPHQVLLQGSVHAREHMTALLMMAQLEYCLKHTSAPAPGGTVGRCLEGVCLRILPMTNPDGVTISQTAKMTAGLQAVYARDRALGFAGLSPSDYLTAWKANAAGVDVNRNFPAGWEALETTAGPSASRYRGAQPGDQPETRALMEYTQKYDFEATVSYHAQGCALYWQYGDKEEVNRKSNDLALAVRACTQYTVLGADGLDAGGYKDWAMDALGIPSVTVEIGGRDCPLPLDEFYTAWTRNRNVPAAVAEWAKKQP